MSKVSIDTGTQQLLCALQDSVATITLNRPDARNAMTPEMTGALRQVIAQVAVDDRVRAVILTGAGSAFCSGADVKAMGQRSTDNPPSLQEQFTEMSARHHEISGALRRMRKPTLAAVSGPAAGAGMAIALACDLRIWSDTAFMSTGYAKIGLSGDYGVAWLLTRIIGPAFARELMLTSERTGADRALQLGLANRCVAGDELARAAHEWAAELAAGPAQAYAYMKDNLDEALHIDHATAIDREADRLLKTRSTEDHREAVRAFAEKRPPQFTGN